MCEKFIELAEPIKGPIILRGKAVDWMVEYLKTHPPNPGWIKQQREEDKKTVKRLEEMGIVIRQINS